MSPAPAVRSVSHAGLGGPALFQSLAAGGRALAFYRWSPWSADDRARAAQAAADAATSRSNRDAVADVLAEQNRAWGGSAAVLEAVERLRDPASVAVVTGQQLGLFAGPLYTVYKAQTAVRLAARLEAETGRPAVPVFWLADEDHDFAEVFRTTFAHGEETRTAAYDDGRDPDADRGAVGRIVLEDGPTGRALAGLEAALPDGPGRGAALEAARAAYVPGRTMRDAFARLLRALVPDVVLISADDPRLKRLGAPLFRAEVEGHRQTLAALEARSAALVEAGFHAQIDPLPVNLFVLGEGRRTAVDPDGDGFVLRGGERLSHGALLDRVEDAPETISPNVVLRPLFQDTILPTAAYVAGPGEAAYFAQLGPVYDLFGVPMPVVEPRLSLTVVEPGVAKVLDRYGLGAPDLGAGATAEAGLHALWERIVLDASEPDLEAAFETARRALGDAFARLRPALEAVDRPLLGASEAAQTRALRELERLETKAVRLEKRNHDVVRQRLARAQAALWPGAPQERVLGPLGLAARHGLAAVRGVVDAVPLDTTVHHTVRL